MVGSDGHIVVIAVWLAGGVFGLVATMVLTWLFQAWRIRRRIVRSVVTQLPIDLPQKKSPRFRLVALRRRYAIKHGWSVPKLALLDSDSHVVELVAVLDALATARLGWSITKQGIVLLTDSVERMQPYVLLLNQPLRVSMEHLAHLTSGIDVLFGAVLPPEMVSWLEHTQLVNFAHVVQSKIAALESGHLIQFHPGGAESGIDLPGPHVAWVTLFLSTIREIGLLSRNETTLDRALRNATIDVAGVSTGVWLGTIAATFLAVALDVTLTGGVATALLGLGGIGGGVVGARAARKIKRLRLDELAERYLRAWVETGERLECVNSRTRRRLQWLLRRVEQRRVGLCDATESNWRADVACVLQQRDAALASFARQAPALLESARGTTHERLAELDAAYVVCRRTIWWPSSSNVALWLERRFLRRTRACLDHAASELRRCSTERTIEVVWPILREAAAHDPLLVLMPALITCAKREREFGQRIDQINATHRATAEQQYQELRQTLDARSQKILDVATAEATPAIASLQQLDEEVRREAATLGERLEHAA